MTLFIHRLVDDYFQADITCPDQQKIPPVISASPLVIGTLLLSGCDSKEDAGVKTIARFKDLTPPPFSDVVAHKSDIEQE